MKHMEEAKKMLKAAIARHERHMAGTEPTDEASQRKLMDEMRAAYAALEDMPEKDDMKMTGPGRFRRS